MFAPVIVIRHVDLFLRTVAAVNEVIALYPEQMIIARYKKDVAIPPAVFERGGARVLLELPAFSPPIVLTWDQIQWVESHTIFVPQPETRFRMRFQNRRRTFRLPAAEAAETLDVLRVQVGGRIQETADSFGRTKFKTALRMLLIVGIAGGLTAGMIWWLGDIARGGKPPHGKALLVWLALKAMLAAIGYWPSVGVAFVVGAAIIAGGFSVVLGQWRSAIAELFDPLADA